MKYIKTHETFLWNKKRTIVPSNGPQIGDYVMCKDSDEDNVSDFNIYVATHVGQLIDYRTPQNGGSSIYVVKYENAPANIGFNWLDDDTLMKKHYDRRGFFLDEIKFWSPDKEEVEKKLLSDKFNI